MKTTAAPDLEPAAPAAAKAEIAERARELGFDAVGFAAPEQPRHVAADLGAFLEQGLHGEMDWLARNAGRRASPKALWPEVATVIALGMNYTPGEDPLALLPRRALGAVSGRANVRGAFAAGPRAGARLAGRTVWLVDDVMTSGATLAECARALRRAGAERVCAAVVARAGPGAGETESPPSA